ncbi:hypothetical protein [Demetria terragena]|uniref:hypothetical protein n=1 Tax=Demetria terragena TaxID=63959 RepID=UPI00035C1DA6|nr:hypothetical protein [Demetria terragena]
MDLLSSAVTNNVDWCALVCRRGGITDNTNGIWLVTGSPAPLFPDAVTLKSGVSARQLSQVLSGRKACSVKDSYADVDLEPYGFSELFTARWIGQTNGPKNADPTGWSHLTETAELESWCAAAELPEVLPIGLLRDPSVRILGAYREGRLVAGAVANSSDRVVGISNVFQVGGDRRAGWGEVASVVARFFPGKPVVGYEHGPDLDAALAAGFSDLGPLRVWLRSPAQ